MEAKFYKRYSIWGHAIRQGIRYAASGTITQRNKLVEASGVLGCLEGEEQATSAGLAWCRAWVDNHG
ncbi:hypothetical protein [Paraburkholderia kururiensis]|uniref:hypothetical protein n=1 Tax=Paraburkholderia kururiensis TaxID=984307 RepID=UPI0039A5788E